MQDSTTPTTQKEHQRLNKYLAAHTALSRRSADTAIASGHVRINDRVATLGDTVSSEDIVYYNGTAIVSEAAKKTILLLHKPVGFVCSRNGQGSRSIYSLLPAQYQHLNIAGRLDKDSSGLVLFTDNGEILNELTHPSNHKTKTYHVTLNRELAGAHIQAIKKGVDIGDERPSKFIISGVAGPKTYQVIMEEGRNRQIRRTLEALGYEITSLHRVSIGAFKLGKLLPKKHTILSQ